MPKETSTENNPKGLGNVNLPGFGSKPAWVVVTALVIIAIVVIYFLTPKKPA